MVFWRFGGKGSINESVNHGGVFRKDPATPGLLVICKGKLEGYFRQPIGN